MSLHQYTHSRVPLIGLLKILQVCIVGLALSLASGALAEYEKTMKFCGVAWPPFTDTDGEGKLTKGISVEIYSEAFRRLGNFAEFHEVPWVRCERGVHSEDFDGIIDNADLPQYAHTHVPTAFYPYQPMSATTIH